MNNNNRVLIIYIPILFLLSTTVVNAGNVEWKTYGGGSAFGELIIIACIVVGYFLFNRSR